MCKGSAFSQWLGAKGNNWTPPKTSGASHFLWLERVLRFRVSPRSCVGGLQSGLGRFGMGRSGGGFGRLANGGRAAHVIAIPEPHRRRSEAVAACIRTCEANSDQMQCGLCRKHGIAGWIQRRAKCLQAHLRPPIQKGERPLVESGRQRPAHRKMLPRKHPLVRLPRMKSLSRRSRITKENGMHPFGSSALTA